MGRKEAPAPEPENNSREVIDNIRWRMAGDAAAILILSLVPRVVFKDKGGWPFAGPIFALLPCWDFWKQVNRGAEILKEEGILNP